jgi:trimethylamine corrinoid protein
MAISLISITDSVIDGDKKRVEDLVQRAIDENINRREILNALIKGIHDIGEKWTRLEVFIPDVMIATDVMKAGMGLLAPHLKKGEDWVPLGRVVLGTVKGDIHDIGKNIVGSMLSSSGFDVYDIGVDKPAITFIEKAKEVNADIIAISALLTTTMKGQQDIVELLTSMGSRNCFIVMVGGGPVTQEWANSIGADGYAETAAYVPQLANELIRRKRSIE